MPSIKVEGGVVKFYFASAKADIASGAAAALVAAAARPLRVKAAVSRGGRPDLAGDMLASVRTPTLLIVGTHDTQVLQLNRMAMKQLPGKVQLLTVEGATHLFEEPGTLDQVARHAAGWFRLHLRAAADGWRPPEHS